MQYTLFKKMIAAYIAICILAQNIITSPLFALTSGPKAPDFSGFSPIEAKDNVDLFTGNFAYNIPLMTVPGPHGSSYPINLSYNADIRPQDESSWVGLGWNLNPGAINRQKRGFADDWNGKSVTYHQKQPKSFTSSYTIGTGATFLGDGPDDVDLIFRYDYNKGYGLNLGIGYSMLGAEGYYNRNINEESGEFSISVNPVSTHQAVKNVIMTYVGLDYDITGNSLADQVIKSKINAFNQKFTSYLGTSLSSGYGVLGAENINFAFSYPEYSGYSVQYNEEFSAGYWGFDLSLGQSTSYSSTDFSNTKKRNAYGYLYSHNANPDNGDIMDYFNEKELSFQKHDNYLPIPYSNPDQFIATAQGLNGGFRIYSKQIGHFSPAATTNKTTIITKGISSDISILSPTPISLDGEGENINSISSWNSPSDFSFSNIKDEAYYMMFDNDLASDVFINDQYDNDKVISASLQQNHTSVSNVTNTEQWIDNEDMAGNVIQDYKYSLPSDLPSEMNNGERVNRSSYIGFHTNTEVSKGLGYNASEQYKEFIDRAESAKSDQIGEIIIYNENGMRYNFGIPVYTTESSMAYSINESDEANIIDNFILYKKVADKSTIESISGMVADAEYASTFLLTDMVSSDYIDRTRDGVTSDDFGSYTKFNYIKNNGTYRWRTPYSGLLYTKGDISSSKDDKATVTYGEKEIYTLESIETKTHIAKFIVSDRADGMEAAHNDTACYDASAKGNRTKLKKLDRIELYAKDDDGNASELLHTVHFEYDYSLQNGIPNFDSSADSNYSAEMGTGKLTLKKVWMEFKNISNAKITPYEFSYEYKQQSDYANSIQSLYSDVTSYGNNLNENKDYSEYNVDAWGYHQQNGDDRKSNLRNWVDQTPGEKFDPASYCLKGIKLPSGGEILVQYEQDDYQYVQNYPAFTMVSIKGDDGMQVDTDELKVYLDLTDLNIDENDFTAITDFLEYLKNYFKANSYLASGTSDKAEYSKSTSNKIYAKFLFELISAYNLPALDSYTSEYISTYLDVIEVGAEGSDIYIKLGKTDYDETIAEVAQDFLLANRGGLNINYFLDENTPLSYEEMYWNHPFEDAQQLLMDYEGAGKKPNPELIDPVIKEQLAICSTFDISSLYDFFTLQDEGDFLAMLGSPVNLVDENLLGKLKYETVLKNVRDDFQLTNCPILDVIGENVSEKDFAKWISPKNSYLRIPVRNSKLGGGLRVKRILTYDSGIGGNADEAVLFGKEYVYQLTDGTSSGVSTNEPDVIREENGIIQQLNIASSQTIFQNSLLFGKDKRIVDGPIGEQIYPSSSVGYSRVIVKDIYDGKGNPGFTEYLFNTAKDYPVESKIGDMDYQDFNPDIDWDYEDLLHTAFNYSAVSTICAEVMEPVSDIVLSVGTGGLDPTDIYTWLVSGDNPIEQFQDNINSIKSGLNKIPETAALVETCDEILDHIANLEWLQAAQMVPDLMDAIQDLVYLLNREEEEHYMKMWAAQGYVIVMHDMHGTTNAVALYEGDYADIHQTSNATMVSQTLYHYSNADIALNTEDDNHIFDNSANEYPGRVQEVVMESKAIKNDMTQTIENEKKGIDNVNIAVMGAFPVLGTILTALELLGIGVDWTKRTDIISQEQLYTHVTNKIVRYSPVITKIENYRDGISTVVENKLLSKNNGSPILQTTYDEFDGMDINTSGLTLNTTHNGTYNSYTFPASYGYELMGTKSINEGFCFGENTNDDLDISIQGTLLTDNPYLTLIGNDVEKVTEKIFPGDLIALITSDLFGSNQLGYYHIKDLDGDKVYLYPIQTEINSIIGVNEVYVIQSAMQNRLSENIGSLVTYGDCGSGDNGETETTVGITIDTITTILTTESEIIDIGAVDITTSYDPSASLALLDPDLLTTIDVILPSVNELIDEALDVSSFMATSIATSISLEDLNILMDNYYANIVSTNVTEISSYNLAFYYEYATDLDFSYSDFYNTIEKFRTNNPDAYISSIENNFDFLPAQSTSDIVSILNQQLTDFNNGSIQEIYYMPENSTSKNLYQAVEIINLDELHIGLNFFKENGEKNMLSLAKGGKFVTSGGGNSISYKTDNISIGLLEGDEIAVTDGNIGYAVKDTYDKLNNCVVKASAIKLDNSWDLSDDQKQAYGIDASIENKYLTGELGKYRSKSAWAYNTDIIGGNNDEEGERVYLGAGAAESFSLFNWDYSHNDNGWNYVSSVTAYSPNGEVLVEKNLLDIYSSVKYGYNQYLPYLVTKNAEYDEVFFESFENYSNNTVFSTDGTYEEIDLEDNYSIQIENTSTATITVSAANSHSGKNSLLLHDLVLMVSEDDGDVLNGIGGTTTSVVVSEVPLKTITLNNHLLSSGLLVQLWLKTDKSVSESEVKVKEASALFSEVSMSRVIRVGEWELYEASITNFGALAENEIFTPLIHLKNDESDTDFYLDDVRYQPADAEMSCYVYDNSNLNLLTSFDSQHLGLFYQYNAEGKLIRKIAETIKGKRTISENYYHTVGKNR